jgi:hypothetical protein
MAGPARDDGGVRFRRALRIAGPARRPGPVAGAVLAGCSSGIPAASSRPGRSVAGSAVAGSAAAGCARWPAGSARTILLISQASNGQQYCVHPGQSVQVFLGGKLSPVDGAEPPRLAGTGLVPASSGQAHLLRSPAAAYQAVRAGRVVLTIVRQPCHSVPPSQTPAAGP